MPTIVVGFIATPHGNLALDGAISEAKLRDAHLVVVHSRKTGTEREAEDIIRYEKALDDVARRLRAEGVPHTIHDYVRGNTPAEDLVAAAAETEAELIVIGLRRRTPTGKYLLGSNAQDILLTAPCPVLAVNVPGED